MTPVEVEITARLYKVDSQVTIPMIDAALHRQPMSSVAVVTEEDVRTGIEELLQAGSARVVASPVLRDKLGQPATMSWSEVATSTSGDLRVLPRASGPSDGSLMDLSVDWNLLPIQNPGAKGQAVEAVGAAAFTVSERSDLVLVANYHGKRWLLDLSVRKVEKP